MTDLTPLHIDTLKELSNISMGHSATALSSLLGETILICVPKVTVTKVVQIPELLGGPERMVAAVQLRMEGDARGFLLLVFSAESADRLLSRLLGQYGGDLTEQELGASTLKEVGNILSSFFLGTLGTLTGLSIRPSVPHLAVDMAGAVVDSVLIELIESSEHTLAVEAKFHTEDADQTAILGHVFLLPDSDSLARILNAAQSRPC